MLNKKMLCAALTLALNISCINQIHGHEKNIHKNTFSPVGKSKIINKTTTIKFFTEKKTFKNDPIAIIRYSWTPDRTTIHLDFFKIMSRKNRKKGLGKQLFTYFITYIQKVERKAKTVCWTAQTLDPEHMPQEKLETFYKSLGGIKLYSKTCDNVDCTCESPISSEFNLEIDTFTLTDTSLLDTMNIIEESTTTRVKTLFLVDKSTSKA